VLFFFLSLSSDVICFEGDEEHLCRIIIVGKDYDYNIIHPQIRGTVSFKMLIQKILICSK